MVGIRGLEGKVIDGSLGGLVEIRVSIYVFFVIIHVYILDNQLIVGTLMRCLVHQRHIS